jgi:DNA polymerase-3 subunit epsilon
MFMDTETNALPDYGKRARDPSQPHIVQLACMTTDDLGNELEFYDQIAKPTDWEITKELSDIHGITHEHALEVGIDEKEMLQYLLDKIKKSSLIVAHNVSFDCFVARCGMRRFELFDDTMDEWWRTHPRFCTMKKMTDVVKLPNKNGKRGFKFPRLAEAFQFAFKKPFEGTAHNAAADLRATKELYFWMQKNNIK